MMSHSPWVLNYLTINYYMKERKRCKISKTTERLEWRLEVWMNFGSCQYRAGAWEYFGDGPALACVDASRAFFADSTNIVRQNSLNSPNPETLLPCRDANGSWNFIRSSWWHMNMSQTFKLTEVVPEGQVSQAFSPRNLKSNNRFRLMTTNFSVHIFCSKASA